MQANWASESCCACLVTANVSTMYSLSDPETMKLYKECTSIYYRDDEGHLPQHLCVMCYKQCEIWKCFKTRCQDNHRLMGYPETDFIDEEATEEEEVQHETEEMTVPHPIAVKAELEDNEPEYMNMAEDDEYQEEIYSSSYDPDPLEMQNAKKAKRKSFQGVVAQVSSQVRTPTIAAMSAAAKKYKSDMKFESPGRVSSASHNLYMKTYRDFVQWKSVRGEEVIDEDLMLEYFQELSKSLAPTTLTNKLSHLVKMIEEYHNIKIDGYHRVRAYCREVKTRHSAPTMS